MELGESWLGCVVARGTQVWEWMAVMGMMRMILPSSQQQLPQLWGLSWLWGLSACSRAVQEMRVCLPANLTLKSASGCWFSQPPWEAPGEMFPPVRASRPW